MKFNQLKTSKHKKPSRVGRGISAGGGKTAGRGTKGQGARKSGGTRPGFEGGQMPIYMRLPQLRGFKSHRPKTEVVYTGQLDLVNKQAVDNQTLFDAGLITSPYTKVKLLLKGDVKTKKTVSLQAASQSAIDAVKKTDGSFNRIDRVGRTAKRLKAETTP